MNGWAFLHPISADVRSLPFPTGCVFQSSPHSSALLWSCCSVSDSLPNTRCRLIGASRCLRLSQTAVIRGCQLTFSTVLFVVKVLQCTFETAASKCPRRKQRCSNAEWPAFMPRLHVEKNRDKVASKIVLIYIATMDIHFQKAWHKVRGICIPDTRMTQLLQYIA